VSDVVGVVADEKYIGEHLDLLEQFALGLAEAAKTVRQNPQHAAEVDTYYLDGLNVEDAVDAIRHSNWDTRMSVCMDTGILATGNGMVKDGLIKMPRPFTVEDFRDTRVIDKIMAEHPEFFDDLPPLPKTVADCKGPLG
jgi:NitT/TauT family transport system substrate-binding protein/sulfonate transport system substrate-binding protein